MYLTYIYMQTNQLVEFHIAKRFFPALPTVLFFFFLSFLNSILRA